ncbi:hypothetical protein PU345_002127 [Enterobacter kobei]|nr:hypothetical protein [Enterobacter kobei]
MTSRQRRVENKAHAAAAAAPRKSYLGRFTPLTAVQSAWIKSLLAVWGEGMRGGTAPKMPREHACWGMLRGARWSEKALQRFTVALNQARDEGYRGEHALNRAHAILWPRMPVSVIDSAMRKDDVDFVEQAVLAAFDTDDPVCVIGKSYYTTRKTIADITRELQRIAPWLTPEMARERVKWCLQIFRAKTFLAARSLLNRD